MGLKCFAFNPGCIKTGFYTDFEDEVEGREKKVGSYVKDEVDGEKEMAARTLRDVVFDMQYMAVGLATRIARRSWIL